MEESFIFVFCRFFIYVLPLNIQLSTGKCWNPINRFNQPHFCPCLKLGHGFSTACRGLFCVQSVKMRGDCWYWWNWWPSLFKLYLHNFSTHPQV